MKTIRVYLDTSVIGGCFDEEFKTASWQLIQDLATGRLQGVLSDLLLQELSGAPPEVADIVHSKTDIMWEWIERTEEVLALAQAYMDAGIVSERFRSDCEHVALASVSEVDLLVSWNFKHIVRYDKIRMFNAVNLAQGYRTLDIRSPLEVIDYDE